MSLKTTFVTSDTHFSHYNIIKYCNRPFVSATEMNETIIQNWNSVVAPGNLVFHLGDFSFGRGESGNYEFLHILSRLNGNIVFIKGNHDKIAWYFRSKFYASYDTYHEINIENKNFVLCHYPIESWNGQKYGSIHLHGHVHGNRAGSLPNTPSQQKILDVGVDVWHFRPVSLKDIVSTIDKRISQI